MTTAKQAEKLGLRFFKNHTNGAYYLCKELKNYNFNDYPIGLKFVFAHARLKAIKAFLAELAKKKECREYNKLINEGVSKRAKHFASLKKPANNEPSLFDFVS